jgi:hypothetical protein
MGKKATKKNPEKKAPRKGKPRIGRPPARNEAGELLDVKAVTFLSKQEDKRVRAALKARKVTMRAILRDGLKAAGVL